MSEFASTDQCHEVLDAIADLIPAEEFKKSLDRVAALRATISDDARIGSARTNRYGTVEFNPLIPTAWSADIHDQSFSAYSIRAGRVTERYKRPVNHPGSKRLGQFDVYGLDIYSADSNWNNIQWDVLEPLDQEKDELAIFLGGSGLGSGLGPGGRISAVNEGHADYDADEPVEPIHSLRLTEDGAEFLLYLLRHTKTYELTGNPALIQPRQLQLEV